MRTIRITGTGNLKIRPDLTRISVTMTEVKKDYAETLKASSDSTEALKDLFSGFGFGREELKTLSFGVDPEFESYREKNEYRQRLIGYRYRHMMKIEFPSDNERLGRQLYALANSELCPEFNISYTVKDREAAKNALLAKAVTDAKEKAAVLTEAAGLTLKEIQSVDYSRGELVMEVRPMNMLRAAPKMAADECADASYSMDIEPDDINVSDTVTIVWEIE